MQTGHALRRRSLATTLIARTDDTRGGDALVWRRGFHADHEQVDDHADFGDCGRDGNERVDRLAGAGNQERRERTHEVAGAPDDEQDAQRFGEHP